jgi:hypothetical protein
MGYGFGAFLLAVGLVLALAVNATVSGIDINAVGWILAAVGVLVIVLTAITWTRGRGSRSVATVTHRDGTQTTEERRTSDL